MGTGRASRRPNPKAHCPKRCPPPSTESAAAGRPACRRSSSTWHRRCGSPQQGEPFLANWTPVIQPQTILVPAPMYHTNGFATLPHAAGRRPSGDTRKVRRRSLWTPSRSYRITNFTATPTMLARVADVPDIRQRDLSSVVWIMQGAAVMPPSLLRTWFELLSPEQIVTAYGMTENLGLTALRGDEWLAHPGSVGRGFRDTEIRILDADGQPVAPGEDGDVYLRAPMSVGIPVSRRRHAATANTRRVRHRGRHRLPRRRRFLFIVDRRTDMIVTGGANVFPAEVESALIEHPDRRRRGDRYLGHTVGPPCARRRSGHRDQRAAHRTAR